MTQHDRALEVARRDPDGFALANCIRALAVDGVEAARSGHPGAPMGMAEAAVALSQHGTVAPTTIHQRTDFAASMIDGRTVMELAKAQKSAQEMEELWAYLASRISGDRQTFLGARAAARADVAVAISGIAGPGGGTPENPVGTIYIGYYSPCGVWSRRLVYPAERLAVKTRAVNVALDWMRRKLLHYKVEDFMATMHDSGRGGDGPRPQRG